MPDDGHIDDEPYYPRSAERRIDNWILELEKIADNFWPGNDTESTNLRSRNVWAQIDHEVDWDFIKEMGPLREPLPTLGEDVADICTTALEPHLGPEAHGLGDTLRAELRRQGTDLESLYLHQKIYKEEIPWDAMYPATRKTTTEKLNIKHLWRGSPWNRP